MARPKRRRDSTLGHPFSDFRTGRRHSGRSAGKLCNGNNADRHCSDRIVDKQCSHQTASEWCGERNPDKCAPWRAGRIAGKQCSNPVASSKRTSRPAEGRPLEQLLSSVLPEAERLDAVSTCLDHVRLLVRQLLGEEAAVVVQGSYAQGLALRGSDLDVAVVVDAQALQESACGPDIVDRRRAVSCLHRLADELAAIKSEEIRIALKIFTARVPVLRLHFRVGTSTDAEICKKDGHEAQNSGRLVVDVSVGGSLARGACDRCVHALLQRDSSGVAAALCRFVKLWAKRRGLTNTLRGGLSSFGFVLLVIFFLQRPKTDVDVGIANFVRLPPHDSIRDMKSSAVHSGCPKMFGAPSCGAEKQIVNLLVDFFAWASEKLPSYGDRALSVMTGKAEPRWKSKFVVPLILKVPSAPEQNAARCLRRDIWEGRILPEFARAGLLAKRLLKRRGPKAGDSVVRALFMSAAKHDDQLELDDVEKDEAKVADPPEEASMGQGSTQPPADDAAASSNSPMQCSNWVNERKRSPMIRPGEALEDLHARHGPKRRRRGKGLVDTVSAEAPAHDKPRVSTAEAAPLKRWLGLRALLNPADEAQT